MAVLPLMTSSTRHGSGNSGPFETTAFAGHSSVAGYWCNCDPGADGVCTCCGAGLNNCAITNEDGEDSAVQDPPSIASQQASNSEASAAVLLLLVALLTWSRM